MRQFINYKNIICAQVPSSADFFKKIIQENNFKTIIEIGTNRGGLTLWLNDHKKPETKIYSFEIDINTVLIDPSLIDGQVIIGDVFSNAGIQKIVSLINSGEQTLFLCDGGHKNLEFNTFSKYLKTNDIIMLHDYEDGIDDYRKVMLNTGWETMPESSFSAIKESVKNYNLNPYMYESAKDSLWGCFIKK
jgi:cephalosporin hydroxylase